MGFCNQKAGRRVMDDKLFGFLGRGSEVEGKGIKIQSSTAREFWLVSLMYLVYNTMRPALTTILMKEQRKYIQCCNTVETNIYM